jgi:ankyrin repeat protein
MNQISLGELDAQFVAQLHCNPPIPIPFPLHLPHQLFNRGGCTALHEASCRGHLDVVKALVAAKSDVNAKNR